MIDAPPFSMMSTAAKQRMAYVCRMQFLLLNGFEHLPFGQSLPATDGESTTEHKGSRVVRRGRYDPYYVREGHPRSGSVAIDICHGHVSRKKVDLPN